MIKLDDGKYIIDLDNGVRPLDKAEVVLAVGLPFSGYGREKNYQHSFSRG